MEIPSLTAFIAWRAAIWLSETAGPVGWDNRKSRAERGQRLLKSPTVRGSRYLMETVIRHSFQGAPACSSRHAVTFLSSFLLNRNKNKNIKSERLTFAETQRVSLE